MNQQDYKNKQPAVEEEPNEFPPDYQNYLDSLPKMTEEDQKQLDEWLEGLTRGLIDEH